MWRPPASTFSATSVARARQPRALHLDTYPHRWMRTVVGSGSKSGCSTGGLVFLEARIVARDASGVIDARTSEFGITWLPSLKAPQLPGSVKVRRITIFVLEFRERLVANISAVKAGYDCPTRNGSCRINSMRTTREIRRHHQIPAHKRERGSVAGVHSSRFNKYDHEKRKLARAAGLGDEGAALAYSESARRSAESGGSKIRVWLHQTG